MNRNLATTGVVGGGGVFVASILACVMSKSIAVLTLGGEAEAMRIVFFQDMNAISDRQMMVAGGGAALAIVSAIIVLGSMLRLARRDNP